MAKYELMLILNPEISSEDRDASLDNLKKIFEQNQVKIEKEDIWWDRKLAYKINWSDKGFYILYNLELDWKVIIEMTKTINLDKKIYRLMFVKKDS